jgi:hypothetical protein
MGGWYSRDTHQWYDTEEERDEAEDDNWASSWAWPKEHGPEGVPRWNPAANRWERWEETESTPAGRHWFEVAAPRPARWWNDDDSSHWPMWARALLVYAKVVLIVAAIGALITGLVEWFLIFRGWTFFFLGSS